MKQLLAGAIIAFLSATAAASSDTDRGTGVLRKVDMDNQRIVIRHGDWANGNMSAMTMAMPVRSGVTLDSFSKGDKVRFEVARQGAEWVVTRMESEGR